jgi:adenylosuccinate synthase
MRPKIIMLAGLGFGDEGKGATTDYLVRRHNAKTVVRYNGGAQAAHNVVTADGRHHTYSQFGSASFVPGVKTFLSRFMVVNPFSLIKELRDLENLGVNDLLNRLFIDQQSLITTPYHIAANRLREWLRQKNRHGSCGMGVGETITDHKHFGKLAVFMDDLAKTKLLTKKLEALRKRKLDSFDSAMASLVTGSEAAQWLKFLLDQSAVSEMVNRYVDFASHIKTGNSQMLSQFLDEGPVVFEGAQGVLLDSVHGFLPHVTQSDTTFRNATSLLTEAGCPSKILKVGVLRSYATRHGAGPLITEDGILQTKLSEPHNSFGTWQGSFRFGYFDTVSTRYALEVLGGVDEIHLTCCDQLGSLPALKICTEHKLGQKQITPIYQIKGGIPEYLETIARLVNVPITYAFGPTAEQRLRTVCGPIHLE